MLLLMTMLESNLSRVRLFLSRLWRRCRGGQLLFSNVVLLWRRLKTIFSNTRSFKMSFFALDWRWYGCGAPYKTGKLWLSIFGEIIQTCRSASLQFLALVSSRREPTVLKSTLTSFSRREHISTMFVINPRIEMTWQDNVCEDRKDMTNSTMFAITVATVRNALIVSSHLGVKKIRLQAIFRWKRSVFEVAVKITCLFIHSS